MILIMPAERAGLLVYVRGAPAFWVADLATVLRLLEVLL